MAKVIKYKFVPVDGFILSKELPYSTEAEEIARREAYNGEYTVEDDGQPEPEPTEEERIAQLEAALELLLSGVTE